MASENGGRRNGRKKSKSKEQGSKKKEAQRGMGVAQLEALRTRGEYSGSMKMSSEFNINPNPNPFHPQTSHQIFPAATYFGDPAARNCGGMNNNGSGLNQGLVVQRVGNNGLLQLGPGHNFSGAGGMVYSEQFPVDNFSVAGAPNSMYQAASCAGNVNMSSDVCTKKKRYNMGEVGEGSGVFGDGCAKNSYGCFVPPISGGSYKQIVNIGQFQGFGPKPQISHAFPSANISLQEARSAVYKQHNYGGGSYGGSSSNVLMEYEFFPEKEKLGGRKSWDFENWIKLGSESSSVAVGGCEANSCLTTTTISPTTAFAASASSSSSSIDLSLKLSID